MLIKTSAESGKNFERPHIAEAIYTGELTEVKDIADGQYGKRLALIYKINVNEKEIKLSHICYVPEVATPDNKLGKVLIAHGVDLGKQVELNSLVGTKARVMVEDYEFEEDGKKDIASSISKVKPLTN